MLGRKVYRDIAQQIGERIANMCLSQEDTEICDSIVNGVMLALEMDNPAFNRATFRQAIGKAEDEQMKINLKG